MNWGAAKGMIGIIACLAIQGCAGVEQTAGDDANAIVGGDQGSGIPQLPVFQPASVPASAAPAARPAPKPVRRARARPATEIARLPDPPPADAGAADPPPAEAPLPPAVVPAPEPVAPKLVGLNEEELVATLGTPTERQDLMPGKLWRYQLPGCTVSVSLYPEVQTMIFRSLSYEVISNDDSPDGVRACLSRRSQSVLAK